MKKTISAISEGGVIYKDYCKHSNNEVSLSFDWRIDITDTSIFSDSGKGNYILGIKQINNNTNHNISISSCSFRDKKIKQNSDGTIKISGDGTIDVKVQFTINSNIIPNKNINYRLVLTKVGSDTPDTQSEIFSFSLTNNNALCSICKDENDRGICRIEGVRPIEYIGEGNSPENGIKVADIVISPVANANVNDKVVILYNNIFEQQPTENDNIKVKYGNVFIKCYLELNECIGVEARDNEIIIPVCQDRETKIPVIARNIPPFASETQELTVSAEIQYSTCNKSTGIITICGTTPYKQSNSLNKIKVSILDPSTNNKETIINESIVNKPVTIIQNRIRQYKFFIENEAINTVNELCGLHVRNIKRTVSPIDNAKHFKNKDFSPNAEWDLENTQSFYIHNAINEPVIIENTNSSNCNDRAKYLIIPFDIDYNKLGDINIIEHNGSVDVKVSYEFEYKEDKLKRNELGVIIAGDDDDNYIPYKFEFILTINRSYIREWHALDFGTSAVVKIKSKDWAVQEIADLKRKKQQLLLDAYPNDENKRLDTGEEDAPNLIASTLFVNPAADTNATSTTGENESNNQLKDGEKRANEYLSSNLWFSPSSEMPNPGDRLPCIKNLIGNKKLPHIKGISELAVNDIVNSAYKQLCQNYLYDEKIEGLILTVPNSFTPLHISRIREIVMEQISTLQKDKLKFISESDAVLWSYIKKTRDGIRTFKEKLQERGTNKERILIFDMGAGTLDISYAECTDTNYNDKFNCDIDIIAKIGVSKAGNYIDYLLGEIILQIMGAKGVSPILWNKFSRALSISDNVAPTGYSDKKKLRNYLRNTVKVMLGKDETTPLPAVNPTATDEEKYKLFDDCENYYILREITVGDILNHKLFKEYIDSCTNKLIKELANKHGKEEYDLQKRDKKILVDTVILSGRTTSLPGIGKNLKVAIRNYTVPASSLEFTLKELITDNLEECKVEDQVIYYDENNKASESLSSKEQEELKALKKTVVARGALDYLQLILHNTGYHIKSEKRIYGSYGLLLVNGTDITDWIPLIDETDYQNDYVYNKITNVYSKQIRINTAGKTQVLLCHTYNVAPLTEALSNNYDSITVLGKENTNGANNIYISLEITDSREINVVFDGDENNLQPHDDYSNKTLRKSLWPVVYR